MELELQQSDQKSGSGPGPGSGGGGGGGGGGSGGSKRPITQDKRDIREQEGSSEDDIQQQQSSGPSLKKVIDDLVIVKEKNKFIGYAWRLGVLAAFILTLVLARASYVRKQRSEGKRL